MPRKLAGGIKPYDPSAPVLQGVRSGVERPLRRALGDAEHRLVSLRLHPPERKSARPARASRFQATVVDYVGGRTLDLHGDVRDPKKIEVVESARQPAVT